ncbi:uncharacterized protein LOC127876787 [Dreissena polymorpha]|uniref:Macrophage migration inhibitory factor n=1 Tax=Dreissena polymorpha TaxID=45954 RepID=A0A9D4KNF0_DREPO|nr:uncharacterized protein LOC127876787 [Dreissena polymorpha]XP_052278222.1 uncharacterized protein LOC127876787 [Dreissena polymorpha]KAH3843113.1 hypothetical protein DPMN_116620 [Dreissena polymorpha]
MMPRFAIVMRTNIEKLDDKTTFLKNTSQYLSKRLETEEKSLSLELQTGVCIMRGGSMDKAFNIDIHHNTDSVDKVTKVQIAEDIATFINKELNINIDKTLVLFFDTRKCS